MVGSELNRTRGKRGGNQGTLERVVFPPLVTPNLRSKRFREHFRTVFDSHSSFFAPKPHGNTCFASSHLSFFFSWSIFRPRSSTWTLGTSYPGAFISLHLALQYPTSARTQEPSDDRLLPLLVCLFLLFFIYFCSCLLSHFTVKVFCCVFFSYTYYIGIQTNCSIFLASKSSAHSFTLLLW